MKKLMALVAAAALSIVTLGAQAQKPADTKMGKMDKMSKTDKMSKMDKGPQPAAASITGKVKGAPNGKSFVVTTATGAVTVDASKAKFANSAAKFVSADKLTAGADVEVKGTKKGATVTASYVRIQSLKDAPAGKMDKMGKTDKMGKMDKMGKK